MSNQLAYAVTRARSTLPKGYRIRLCMERGRLRVEMDCPGPTDFGPMCEQAIHEQIWDCINFAIDQDAKSAKDHA